MEGERGTGCATSCLDPPHPIICTHKRGTLRVMAVFGKCLCELLPGRKYLRSFWRQQAESDSSYPQKLYQPDTFEKISLFLSVRGEFMFPRAAAALQGARTTTKLRRNREREFEMLTWLVLWDPLRIKKQLWWVIFWRFLPLWWNNLDCPLKQHKKKFL